MKRRLILQLGILVLVAGVGALILVWWTAPTHRLTREMHEKIRQGMTRAEVETVLGCPPGYYCTGPVQVDVGMPENPWIIFENRDGFAWLVVNPNAERSHQSFWVTTTGAVHLVYDNNERVLFSSFYDAKPMGALATFQLWLLKRS